jgi:hypothetical protein
MSEAVSSRSGIPVGISACLMGEQVRYNGGHKRSRYCLEVLGECSLMHVFGYLKEALSGETRQDLLAAIEEYRQGHVALAVPIRLLAHYLKRHGSEYIRRQTYLDPHPYELGLRNAI